MKHHIASRIFVAIFCTLYATVLIFSLVFYNMNRRSIMLAVEQGAQRMLALAQDQLALTHEELDELAMFLLNDRTVSRYLSENLRPPALDWFTQYDRTQALMRNYTVGRSHTITGMALVKTGGEVCLTGSLEVPLWPFSLAGITDRFVVRPQSPYTVRAITAAREIQGALVMQLTRDFWADLYAHDAEDGYLVCLYDAEGRVLFADAGYARQTPAIQEAMQARALHQEASDGPQTGSQVLSAQRDPRTGVTAVAYIPSTLYMASLSPLNRQVIALLAGLAVAAAVLARALANGITRNVKALRKNVERIGEGHFDQLTPLRSADEIGELGQTLTLMAQRVELLIEDINQRERLKREMELQFLRAQVSPHFLYNALNTISNLAALQNAQNILSYSNSLIDLLRTTLQPSDTLVTLDQELSYVQSYQTIMQTRNVYGVRLHIEVAPSAQYALVMRMLLQPIVENALIHGLPVHKADGEIRITVSRDGDFLIIRITDNGAGMTPEQIEAALEQDQNRNPIRFSGVGIRNVRERILLQFGPPHDLAITSEPGVYTTVTLTLPFIVPNQEDHHVAPTAGR